jgi:DNA-binding transcriptional ArsR family regulator
VTGHQERSAERVVAPTEALKALSDPIRWNILRQIAAHGELACSRLEEILPVSKPTISYHTKTLAQAGLIKACKRGRTVTYSLEPAVLRAVMSALTDLAAHERQRSVGAEDTSVRPQREAFAEAGPGTALSAGIVTW